MRRSKTWTCCCGCRCEKKSSLEGLQLEDLNHCMLRLIYFFHLLLFGLVVFLGGFLLIPFGYFALLLLQIQQLTYQQYSKANGGPSFVSTSNRFRVMLFLVLRLMLFVVIGPLFLCVRNFSDTGAFLRNCWNSGKEGPL